MKFLAKTYHQFCGVARALDLLGERWTLLIIRDLLLGPLRFSDLLELESGIGPNLLSQRLKRLEAEGVVESRQLAAPARARVYALTAWGQSLEPVVLGLGRFGAERLGMPGPEDRIHFGWAIFSFQRRFTGATGAGAVTLVAEGQPFWVRFDEATIDVGRGEGGPADAVLTGERPGFAGWLSGAKPLAALLDAGLLTLEGERDVIQTLAAAIGL